MKKLELFLWGVILAIVALLAEVSANFILSSEFIYQFSLENFSVSLKFLIFSAFIEEGLKIFVLCKKITPAYKPIEAAFSAGLLGLGFACVEIFLIYFKLEESFLSLGIFWIGILFVHTLLASLAGAFFALNKKNNTAIFTQVLLLTSAFHFAYNYFIYNFL